MEGALVLQIYPLFHSRVLQYNDPRFINYKSKHTFQGGGSLADWIIELNSIEWNRYPISNDPFSEAIGIQSNMI